MQGSLHWQTHTGTASQRGQSLLLCHLGGQRSAPTALSVPRAGERGVPFPHPLSSPSLSYWWWKEKHCLPQKRDQHCWRNRALNVCIRETRASPWLRGKESARQCGRHRKCRFDPWVGKIPWRRKWQPTPVFLPGKFHGQRSLVVYSLWGHKRLRHD